MQEPGAAAQPPGWRQRARFLYGYSAGGAGSGSCAEGKNKVKSIHTIYIVKIV